MVYYIILYYIILYYIILYYIILYYIILYYIYTSVFALFGLVSHNHQCMVSKHLKAKNPVQF